MITHLVYRIEDDRGLGPFQDEVAREAIEAERYNRDVDNYPTPANDEGFDQDELWEFVDARRLPPFVSGGQLPSIACCTLDQLRHWFDATDCNALAALGYFLVTFEVPDDAVLEGEFQAVFDRTEAQIVERLSACALWRAATDQLAA